MNQATRITGVGIYPLIKLEAIQYARRARTLRDLEANRAADLAATFWERRTMQEMDWTDEPTYIRRKVMPEDPTRCLCDGRLVTFEEAERAVKALGRGWVLPTRESV